MIEIKEMPEDWTEDQIKIYEIYSKLDSNNNEAIEDLEKLLNKWLGELKIVSWNCNGKFRKKFKEIIEEDADIYVIQECEDPAQSSDEEYREFAGDNYFWIGHLHYKGLGIFAKEDVNIERMDDNGEFEHFLPVRVNDRFNLLGVWAMGRNKEKGLNAYVEMIHDYFDANENLFDENLIMCGDFNSSVEFNDHHPEKKNHTVLNEKLECKGLISVYHSKNKEKQGCEKAKTFYLTRHLNRSFHLDFVYAGEGVVREFDILDHYKWINVSDHLPLVFKI